jgi:hypothetical protein
LPQMKICFSNLGITKMYRIWGVRAGSCWLLASSFWRNLGRWESEVGSKLSEG